MKTIPIIALNGGLGNQLFQWFFAHSIENGGSFRIDRLFKEDQSSYGVAGPELGQLFARCQHIYRDSNNVVIDAKFRKILHLANHMWGHSVFRPLLSVFGYYRENPNAEVAQSLKVPNPIRYAFGYFQNAQLMNKAEEAIESELFPVIEGYLGHLKVKFGLEKPYTVIHLRRYPTGGVKLTRTQFCNLSEEYFIEWARENAGEKIVLLAEHKNQVAQLVKLLKPELVLDSSETSAWEVLTIMAGAEKCLGSNSSLSWWGVRLCSKLGGQVWLPSNWSYWENVNSAAFHFDGCNIAQAKWDISGFE